MSEIDKDINVPNKNDTISRRAAEDIVRFECGEWTGLAETIVKRFEALPSTQPEPIRLRLDHELSKEEYERLKKDCAEQPIILLPKESAQPGEDIRAMCGECDAWNQYKNYPQPRWIPCSETEEAPEYEVIACNADGEVMLGYLSTDGVDWECDSAYELMTDVVAWIKKPKPWVERRK